MIWSPTLNFRWKLKCIGKGTQFETITKTLQQRWVVIENGSEEWRNVPVVEDEE